MSVLFFYWRILERSQNKTIQRILIYSIAFVAAFTMAITFSLVFVCWPIKAVWLWRAGPLGQGKKFYCGSVDAVTLTASALDFTTDLFIAVLPLFFIRRLQLNKHDQKGLNLLFSLAFM